MFGEKEGVEVEVVHRSIDVFLKELFDCEVRSLDDAKNLMNILATRLIATSMGYSYGYGIGLERSKQEIGRILERLKKPPPYVA